MSWKSASGANGTRGASAGSMLTCVKCVVVAVTASVALGAVSCAPGGCYWTQNNFTVTPAESCVQLIHDVCGDTSSLLQNNCAEPLVVQQGLGDAGADPVTIKPGGSGTLLLTYFTDKNGHVSLPAQLGSTEVVISWDIGSE